MPDTSMLDFDSGEWADEDDVERANSRAVGKVSDEERAAKERAQLLEALAAGRQDRVIERVAAILSRHPETRESDIALQLTYWAEYHPDEFGQLSRDLGAMYVLPRLTSLARARARIQNTHRLFVASDKTRHRRKQLSDEERERFLNPPPVDPLLMVYADESGKTQTHLVVGSIWLLDPVYAFAVPRQVGQWREARHFEAELHFNEINRKTLPLYREIVELILGGVPGISFKSISVTRAGHDDIQRAIDDLYVALFRRGVEHEHSSGRAPLPRRIQIWKDLEEPGRDALLATRIQEALTAVSVAELDNRLLVEGVEAVASTAQPLLQLADLYTASINRTLNRAGPSDHPKDQFADFLLSRVQPNAGTLERIGDMHVHIAL